MQKTEQIVVTYDSSVMMKDGVTIRLTMSNELGYVKDAKALFNGRGEYPGAEGFCYLEYSQEESSESESVFIGNMAFSKPGFRTFFIQLKVNNVLKEIKISPENFISELVEPGKEYHFWSLFVYYTSFVTPDWVKGGIMYQIFVDTFCKEDINNIPDHVKSKLVSWDTYPKWKPDSDGEYRNDQCYGGNIKGIVSKLDYIKSLGTTVIYLTPIFESPSQNRYDISNYCNIDEMVGTWDDLDELRNKANAMGIKVIVDCVFNHSSNQNKLLRECPDMYSWVEKYSKPRCWWGYEALVEFNQYSNDYFINLESWLKLYKEHVDGIRLDVADSLSDNTLKFIRNNFEEKYILGEVWKNSITGDFREFLYGDELDGVMNYQYGNAILRFVRFGADKYFRSIVENIYNLYPYDALSVSPIFLSSHDIPRTINILAGEYMQEDPAIENIWDMEKSKDWWNGGKFDTFKFRKWEVDHEADVLKDWNHNFKLLKVAVFLQYTLPGLPVIFAGDEAGVIGYKDPTNRKPFPWDNINKSLLEFYKKLGNFRNSNSDLFAKKNFKLIEICDNFVVYKRGTMVFVVNRTDTVVDCSKYANDRILFCDGNYDPQNKKLSGHSVIVF